MEHDEFFLDITKGKNVIIVGPSPILLGTGKGEEIDSYDLVIRTNNMINSLILNPELGKDYGKRTDILYVNSAYFRYIENWKTQEWISRGLQMLCTKAVRRFPEFPIPLRNFTPKSNNKIFTKSPLLGVFIVDDLLKTLCKSITLEGIDGYASMNLEQKEPTEYLPDYYIFQKEPEKRHHHSIWRESLYFLNLEKKGKIILEDHVKKSLEKSIIMYKD